MKKLLLGFCIFSFLLFGCSNTYERGTTAGEIKDITLAQVDEKLKNQDDFIIVFAQERCGYCLEFHKILQSYLPNHSVTIYEVNLTKEEELMSQQEILSKIHENFEEFHSTPGIFYVENGKKKDYLKVGKTGMSETLFDEWIVKHQLDKVEN